MNENQPIPCPECDREKYFEGLCYECRVRKLREHYENMDKDQIASRIKNIIANIDAIEDWGGEVYKDFIGLLANQDIDTEGIAREAFEKSIFYPPTLYKNASEEIQKELIDLILDPDCNNPEEILSCLVVIGGEKVKNVFYQLEKNPLPWRQNIYVDPSYYAALGGWTFDDNGKQIDLHYKECYSIVNEEREDDAIKIGKARSENCPECGCQIIDILRLDGNDERLSFLGLNGTLTIPICPNCASMCEKIVIRYQLDGESTFEIDDPYEEENFISEDDFKKLTTNQLKLSQTKKPVYFAYGNDAISTIGGHPEWVQDWQYESCPDCEKKMKSIATISWSQVLEGSEGTLYLQICTDCSIVVTFHQQT